MKLPRAAGWSIMQGPPGGTNFADKFWVKNMKIIIFTIPPVVMGLACAFIASAIAEENSRANDSYGVLYRFHIGLNRRVLW
jgi:hypothetical protein